MIFILALLPVEILLAGLLYQSKNIIIQLRDFNKILKSINDKLPDNSWNPNFSQNPTEQNRQIIQLLQDIKRGVMK